MALSVGAGHSYEILKQTDSFLVGIDCDDEALQVRRKKAGGIWLTQNFDKG